MTVSLVYTAKTPFPVGTSVGAYPVSNWPSPVQDHPSGAPVGSATNSQTIATGTTATTFTGLTSGTDYWLVASVGGTYQYVRFTAGADLATGSSYLPQNALDTDGTLAANSDARIASQKATKTYADTKLPSSYLDTDGTLAANSDVKVASQKAVVTYVTAHGVSFPLADTAAAAGTDVLTAKVTGDTNNRFVLNADGLQEFGPGNAASDALLRRGGTGYIYVGDTSNRVAIGYLSDILGAKFGLYTQAGAIFAADGNAIWFSSAVTYTEQSAPSAPAANNVVLYAQDNGSGKTQLMALFNSGAAQQVAIQP